MRHLYSWLRSPNRDSSNSFCNVNDDGSADWNNADCNYALAFGFCIKSVIVTQIRVNSVHTKGVHNLSVRINFYLDMIYWTLLALPTRWRVG